MSQLTIQTVHAPPQSLNSGIAATLPSRSASLQLSFAEELNPVGPVATFIVEEIVRRAMDIRELHAGIAALRREGAAALHGVLTASDASCPSAAVELARAGVLATERHQALLRQSVVASGGFFRSLREYQQHLAGQAASAQIFTIDPQFAGEAACAAHLVRRFDYGVNICSRCESAGDGTFVPSRLCWQCGRCHAQTGLRAGTCFERSAIALTKWFAAIRVLLLSPSTTAAELARFLQIPRTQTVARMCARTRTAMESADATNKLAGLDQIYLGFAAASVVSRLADKPSAQITFCNPPEFPTQIRTLPLESIALEWFELSQVLTHCS